MEILLFSYSKITIIRVLGIHNLLGELQSSNSNKQYILWYWLFLSHNLYILKPNTYMQCMFLRGDLSKIIPAVFENSINRLLQLYCTSPLNCTYLSNFRALTCCLISSDSDFDSKEHSIGSYFLPVNKNVSINFRCDNLEKYIDYF